jgi:ABC-type bacteriocin/lantibiotic exporter with double-glycine peptidase domain
MKEGDRSTKYVKLRNITYRPSSFIIFTIYLFCSCTPISGTPASNYVHYIEDVPFYQQETYQCGPAALAGVLNYWGVDVAPQEIAKEIFSETARGTFNIDMVLYAQSKGVQARYYRGGIEDIQKKISDGFPMIALVDFGFMAYQVNHFIVVIGFNEYGVVVNSGKYQGRLLSWKDFEKAWEKTHFWTLFITPE